MGKYFYAIVAPFESKMHDGEKPMHTPAGVFYCHGVRDDKIDALKVCETMNRGYRSGYRVADCDNAGFHKWVL